MTEASAKPVVAPSFDNLSLLPRQRLQEMQRAGDDLYALLEQLHESGAHPVSEVVDAARGAFTTFKPYPEHGVGGGSDQYAWYYHAHDPAADRPWEENGHFHCFAFVDSLAPDKEPWSVPAGSRPDNLRVTHLIALSVKNDGVPERLFTLNRWASDEYLYPAEALIPLLDGFDIVRDKRFESTSRWLSAMLRLLQPQIAWLLHERDRVLRAAQKENPAGFSEDPSLEITSMLTFDLAKHLAALDRALDFEA